MSGNNMRSGIQYIYSSHINANFFGSKYPEQVPFEADVVPSPPGFTKRIKTDAGNSIADSFRG